MNGFQGADPEALRHQGAAVASGAGRIEDLALRLGALIESVAWTGPDADSFRADWSARVRPGLLERGEHLRSEARALNAHGEEQDRASAPGTDGASAPGRPAADAAPSPGSGPSAAMSAPPPGSGPPPASGPSAAPPASPGHTLGGAGSETVGLRLMAASPPLASAAEVSESIGEGDLAFPETGMELSPPETAHTVRVDADHELAPDGAEEPFGLDADGAPLELAPDTAYDVGDHGTYYTDGEGRISYVEATGGGEEMNPNLREVLPETTYHVNESTYYRTDELGRTEHMYVPDVIVDREMARSQSIQSKIAERWDMAGDGTSEPVEFNAGHVLARQLGGIREEINYTRQWDEVNQARSGQDTIYSYESLMADGITDEGRSYSYETLVTWGDEQPSGVGPEHDSAPWEYVPEGYDVRIHEDGEQIVDAHLPNYPEGARFPD